jgi:hypothetical protein
MAYDFDHYPPSPTLTNPDLILPDFFGIPQTSPTRGSNAKRLSTATNLAIAHLANLNGPFSPETQARPSSPLSAIDESDTTPKRSRSVQDAPLASSPTINPTRDAPEWPLMAARPASGLSNGSSSIHSEDLEKWKPTHQTNETDESVMDEEDEEKFRQFAKQSGGPEGSSSPASKEDYAAEDYLSKRAEIILANAKKRLNVSDSVESAGEFH